MRTHSAADQDFRNPLLSSEQDGHLLPFSDPPGPWDPCQSAGVPEPGWLGVGELLPLEDDGEELTAGLVDEGGLLDSEHQRIFYTEILCSGDPVLRVWEPLGFRPAVAGCITG